MKKNVSRIFGCFVFACALSFFAPSIAKASVKNIPNQKNTNTYSGKVDMNGDGNADSIVIRTTTDKATNYIGQFTFSMNGKTVSGVALNDINCYYFHVKYAKMSKNREFLQVIGFGENDYITYNEIFAYNKKTKQFYSVNDFSNAGSYANEIVSANKNGIVIKHSTQPAETGWISWTLPYKYSKGKFVPTTTSTKTVKSEISNNGKDKYSKYFAKNKFVAAKKLTFYNGKKVAFTVKKGKVVTLTKLSLSKDVIYLQFKYGKKTGYIHVNNTNYDFEKPLFMSINQRLAG